MRDRDEDIGVADLTERVVPIVNGAFGGSWYEQAGNEIDRAVADLCRLRRAAADEERSGAGGDAAVRRALERADREAVVWLASRAISYMDEHDFPELVARNV
jgi:hypothetical protein